DKRVALEERDDATVELRHAVDGVGQHCAARTLRADDSAAEEPDQLLEHRSIQLVLVDVEDGVQLPSARGTGEVVRVHRDGEATFAVDESHDPVRIELEPRTRSFLLIVRTGRIFTAHATHPT